MPAGECDVVRKRRRTGEEEESQSPTYNRVGPHEARIAFPTTAPIGLAGYPPCGPMENSAKKLQDPMLWVHVEITNLVVHVAVAQDVHQALPATENGGGEAREANLRIPRTRMARIPILVRVGVAKGAATADKGTLDMGTVKDMGMGEDIIGMSARGH